MKKSTDNFLNDPDNLLDLSFDRDKGLTEHQQDVKKAAVKYYNHRFAVENGIEKEDFDFFNPPKEMRII